MRTINANWLKLHLNDEKLVIADCRFNLSDPEEGEMLYKNDHIPGALYYDLEKDLSAPVKQHGGRHPLPPMDNFIELLERSGIDRATTVIAYDGGQGAYASRLWWMLTYVGHEKVYILNGGYEDWKKQDGAITNKIPTPAKSSYSPSCNHDMIASYEEVKEAVSKKTKNIVLIDSREEKRYLGIEEPIDKKAGRIPGAINKVWFEGLENGRFRNAKEQQKRFTDIDPSKTLIVYCGSGVTAAPNYIALKEAGYPNVKLYPGSFSDWISYEENEVETGAFKGL
ncbi:sulfurtransferase [Bacillus mesophilum]|uniref:Sulfurtransferase n=1 Tax=Bacillus mesophilum TaxID=1071718 RepID=A0A7V7UYH8_9BACI|nr:sulfurtransferase [Bacillus mesophilum]KAB2333617.1 sulfurtransferase [Bacillus mesophilum]